MNIGEKPMLETSPKPFVFVLMPFEERFADAYQLGIKAACQDAGAYCERVDEQIFVENILERVYNQIAKADIIVAEMTGRNPNVFYEAGYAHALNKRVILLTQNSDDIPFDLKHYPHVVYEGKITLLKIELEKRIRWCIANPTKSVPAIDSVLEFFVNGKPLIGAPSVVATRIHEAEHMEEDDFVPTGRVSFTLDVSIHNCAKIITDPSSFDLALLTPKFWFDKRLVPQIRSSIDFEDHAIHNISKISPLFPDGWDTVSLQFMMWEDQLNKLFGRTLDMNLRLFTEVGTKDYPFVVTISDS
jgi:hypothetical protein